MTIPVPALVDMPVISDERGALGIAQEQSDTVPFPIRRMFYLFDLAPGVTRGHHAHRAQHQLLIMMAGSCIVTVDDGRSRSDWTLAGPRQALHAPPMLWLELNDFSADAVCAVLTSAVYDPADYIRDYDEFRRLSVNAKAEAS